MELNRYLISAKNLDKNSNEERREVLEELNALKKFKTEKEVRDFLKKKFGIKDNIENFTIISDIVISVGVGNKYFNVTYVYSENEENYIKSFNYKLEERNFAW